MIFQNTESSSVIKVKLSEFFNKLELFLLYIWFINNYILTITMSKVHAVLQNKRIEQEVAWIRENRDESKLTNQQLMDENKKILQTLKIVEKMLDQELESKKKDLKFTDGTQNKANQQKVVNESIKNNETVIKNLEKQVKKMRERRQQLKNGLQSKLNAKKYESEVKLNALKAELKKIKLQQRQINKKLVVHQNANEPESLSQNTRLQEQLRVYSIKYMKLLQKYNKVTQQLALASNSAQPQLNIPQQFYDRELEQRQQAQYKQYQGIVKLCTILSKRNDSENNKYNRIYTEKLKELQKIIINLAQTDRMIAVREGEIIEGKKNIELVKYKINNNQRIQNQFFTLSQSSLKKKSVSLSQLPSANVRKSAQDQLNTNIMRKLSKR